MKYVLNSLLCNKNVDLSKLESFLEKELNMIQVVEERFGNIENR